jgi:hypothetical protein
MTKFFFIASIFIYSNVVFSKSPMQECWYFAKNTENEINEKQCFSVGVGKTADNVLGDGVISKKVAAQLDFGNEGLSYGRTANGFFYVNKRRILRNTITFDNGPDFFSEGLARTRVNGKIGYFDNSLKMVIPAQYDFGFPFANGLAIVCNGCVEQADGEHKRMVGGLWGAINLQGKVVHKLESSETQIRELVPN